MKSSYKSRINGIGESSAGGVSCSQYDSNRFTQHHLIAHDVTIISPMQVEQPSQL